VAKRLMTILIVVALIIVAVLGLLVIGLAWLDGGREETRLIETPASLSENGR
jgi:hypothetical protein